MFNAAHFNPLLGAARRSEILWLKIGLRGFGCGRYCARAKRSALDRHLIVNAVVYSQYLGATNMSGT